MLAKLKLAEKLKDIQCLAGCVASLSQFISRLSEKALPLYRLLEQTSEFKWTFEASATLEGIKALLAMNPIPAAPHP